MRSIDLIREVTSAAAGVACRSGWPEHRCSRLSAQTWPVPCLREKIAFVLTTTDAVALYATSAARVMA